MNNCVCCVDLGTTRIKAAIIGAEHGISVLRDAPTPIESSGSFFRGPDGDKLYETTCKLIKSCVEDGGFIAGGVQAVAVTCQRATILPVDKNDRPLSPAISWQNMECEADFAEFIAHFGPDRFTALTGLPPSALWSLGKIIWHKKTFPETRNAVYKYVLLHDYLARRLGAEGYFTDYSNASVTGLLDLGKLEWSSEICAESGIGGQMLPELAPAGALIGKLSREASHATGLKQGTPIIAGGGDQQCAALGSGAVAPGDASLCLGTAAVVSCQVGQPVRDSSTGLFCTRHVVPDTWMLEGINNEFGGSLKWIENVFGNANIEMIENLAKRAPRGAGGVMFFPFLSGIGSPDYDGSARGVFAGLDAACDRADMARAVMEGIVMETFRILDKAASHVRPEKIILSGGPSNINLLSTLFAEITGMKIYKNAIAETTLLGAAMIALTGTGVFDSLSRAAEKMISGAVEAVRAESGAAHGEFYREIYKLYVGRLDAVRALYKLQKQN